MPETMFLAFNRLFKFAIGLKDTHDPPGNVAAVRGHQNSVGVVLFC